MAHCERRPNTVGPLGDLEHAVAKAALRRHREGFGFHPADGDGGVQWGQFPRGPSFRSRPWIKSSFNAQSTEDPAPVRPIESQESREASHGLHPVR
jgi:hypothetical protein